MPGVPARLAAPPASEKPPEPRPVGAKSFLEWYRERFDSRCFQVISRMALLAHFSYWPLMKRNEPMKCKKAVSSEA